MAGQTSSKTRTIEQSVTIKASPEMVFKAITDARELARWFPSTAESDPRPGGAFKYTFKNENAQHDHVREGRYLEVVPTKMVRYPWHMSPGDTPTTVEFTLASAGKETTLSLIHSGWGMGSELDNTVEMHVKGWGFFLQNLKSYVEEGKDQRAAALGMKTA